MTKHAHAAKVGDKIVIVRRPDMMAEFWSGYEIGDIAKVINNERLCVHVEWLTNKGNHRDGIRIRSILPDEYDVLPPDGGIVLEDTDHLGIGIVLEDTAKIDWDEVAPKTITGRKAVVLDRVRVTRLDPVNEDDTYGIVVGDIGEVVAAHPTSIEVRWLTNLGEYDDTKGPLRSFVLYHAEYEIIPHSEPLPT